MSSINNDMKVMISTNPRYTPSMFKDVDMPVRDLAECTAEKLGFPDKEAFLEYIKNNREAAEKSGANNFSNDKTVVINGQTYNANDIPVADFSQLYSFYPTGDHEQDYQIQMGINYNRTCYDGTNRRDYDKLTAAEDFTGMSAAEIYKAIYEKYQHCYGENFSDINAIPYVAPPYSEDSFGQFTDRFNKEIETAINSSNYADVQKARREALYGDMDDYDVRAAIMEKYAADGFTNADLYKVTAEMDRCGVGGGIHNSLIFVLTKDRAQVLRNSSLGIKTSVETACAMYEEMLASPLDTDMLEYIGIYSNAMGATSPKLYSALGQLRETYGGYSGGISADSVSAAAQNAKDDFVWIKI